ncbi:hypothetical protein [Sphingomonas profundi]|uniref:hypothetical protein n=1 Tax=Alterirhizorhabdus profundi TaxID=2681549 RepID=UPI0012E79CD3|nr:hypothetical protein [Sphingomonas profundi]
MNRIALLAPIVLVVAAWPPAAHAASQPPPARTTSLIVYGEDPCPKGDGDEIVVCAREPESERYRIPKKLRDRKAEETGARSWTDRVAGVEEASRPSRPNSCSAVGAGGQSGCTQAMLRQWFAERQAAKAEAAAIP